MQPCLVANRRCASVKKNLRRAHKPKARSLGNRRLFFTRAEGAALSENLKNLTGAARRREK